jgi:hypothetical protein
MHCSLRRCHRLLLLWKRKRQLRAGAGVCQPASLTVDGCIVEQRCLLCGGEGIHLCGQQQRQQLGP